MGFCADLYGSTPLVLLAGGTFLSQILMSPFYPRLGRLLLLLALPFAARAQNVGVGTTAPTKTLDVNGSTRLRGLTTPGPVTTDASGNLSSATAASLDATTAGNGLTETGTDITLGGTLAQATTIVTGSNAFSLTQDGAGGPVVDQQNLNSGGIGSSTVYQTFTAGVSSTLIQLEIGLLALSGVPASFTLSIRQGAGTAGAVLYTTPASYVGTNNIDMVPFAVPGVALVAGQVYTIHLTSPSANFRWSGNSNGYAGGISSTSGIDLLFRTYMFNAAVNGPVLAANGGKVGIGTGTPSASLHVAGPASTVRVEGLAGTGTRLVTTDASGNLAASSTVVQPTYSQALTVAGNGGNSFTWTHNLGYNPIVMGALDQTGGSFADYVSWSYSHLNSNQTTFYFTNRSGSTANFTLRWVRAN